MRASGSRTTPSSTDETIRERVVEAGARGSGRSARRRSAPELHAPVRARLMLQTLDHHWREHLAPLDHLRQGIHLRGYAQKNPKQEYKREAFELFSDMLDRIKQDVVKVVLTVQVRSAAGRAGGRGARAGHQRALPARRLRGGARRAARTTATRRSRRRAAVRARAARRSGATTRARAARARSTSSATAGSADAAEAAASRRARASTVAVARYAPSRRASLDRSRCTVRLPCPSATRRPRRIAAAGAGRRARRRGGAHQEVGPQRRRCSSSASRARSPPACSRRTASAPRR